MGSFNKLKTILEKGDSFLLIAHEQPDGDCLGGILALGESLKKMGKNVTMVTKSDIPAPFLFLEDISLIKKDFLFGNFDVVVLIDNGDLKRTGFYSRLKSVSKDKILVNIDHHPKNDLWKVSSVNYIDENASSTCEILYDLFSGMGQRISPKIATYLLLGIFTDTGGFKHSNTSTKTYKIVSELLSLGAKLKKISENIENYHSISTLKLWGIALKNLRINSKYSIIYSVLLKDDLIAANASDEDISGLINLINTSPGSKIALLLYEASDGKIKGSLRTESEKINVSSFAKLLGGGGHRKASGFSLDGRLIRTRNGWRIK